MNTKTAMITIAGRPNVGKSTLANALVGEKIAIVSHKPQTTRNRICAIVDRGDTQLVFIDTPGFHRPRTKLGDYMVNVVNQSVADVDAAAIVDRSAHLLRANLDSPVRTFTGDHRRGHTTFVFGRRGQPCRRCGASIEADTLGGGTSIADPRQGQERLIWWCPRCQPRP